MSSVFRGASEDPTGKGWADRKALAKRYPGRMAVELMQRLADQVGRDGVSDAWSKTDMPTCAQAHYNRVIAGTGPGSFPASQKRDRREAETLCVALDLMARARFMGMDALLTKFLCLERLLA